MWDHNVAYCLLEEGRQTARMLSVGHNLCHKAESGKENEHMNIHCKTKEPNVIRTCWRAEMSARFLSRPLGGSTSSISLKSTITCLDRPSLHLL
jgi:hypothetical protein